MVLLIDKYFPSLFVKTWYQDTLAGHVQEPQFVFCDESDDLPDNEDVEYYQYGYQLLYPHAKSDTSATTQFIDDLYYDDNFDSSY